MTSPNGGRTEIVQGGASSGPTDYLASAFPFALPSDPGPTGTQATAIDTTDGSTRYEVAYALVTVTGGASTTTSAPSGATSSTSTDPGTSSTTTTVPDTSSSTSTTTTQATTSTTAPG